MGREINLVGIPTEAGTHFPGQSLAPHAIISQAGLASKLREAGHSVTATEDIFASQPKLGTAAKWQPTSKVDGTRNLQATLDVMHAVKRTILESPADYDTGLSMFIGGDCSITPAILSGLHERAETGSTIGLLYVDGDVDLTIPAEAAARVDSTGILDSMVLSHLTQRPGGLEEMKAFAATDGSALVTPENIVLFGFDPLQPSPSHWTYLLENGFKAFARPSVAEDPARCARDALSWLEGRVDRIVVHFDVDVIDSGRYPLANYPHYAGLEAEAAFRALKLFLSSPKITSVIVTEVNPNNDPGGRMIRELVGVLVDGLERKDASTID
jgi:arginase